MKFRNIEWRFLRTGKPPLSSNDTLFFVSSDEKYIFDISRRIIEHNKDHIDFSIFYNVNGDVGKFKFQVTSKEFEIIKTFVLTEYPELFL